MAGVGCLATGASSRTELGTPRIKPRHPTCEGETGASLWIRGPEAGNPRRSALQSRDRERDRERKRGLEMEDSTEVKRIARELLLWVYAIEALCEFEGLKEKK